MAIDPRILLQGRGVNLGNVLGQIGSNVARFDAIQQNRNAAEAQAQQAKMRSISIFGAQVSPMLQAGDIEGAKDVANRRLEELTRQGGDSTETQQFIELLDTNPELAAQRANQAVQIGQKLGFFAGQTGQTAGQREFESLTKAAGLDEGGIKSAARVKLGLDARASNFRERLQFEVDKANQTGDVKVEQDLRKTAGQLGIKLELDPKIAAKTAEAKLPALQRSETIKSNSKRITFLSGDQRKRESSIRKAKQFLKPLEEGRAFSGAGRLAASFVPGVFTTQGQFDEKFNAFAEIAARQQLKASGETRPTDADVEGMKRAMFGVGRDEQVNIQLLQEFIEDQEAMNDELEDLTQSRQSGTLDTFDVQQQRQPVQQAQPTATATGPNGEKLGLINGQWVRI